MEMGYQGGLYVNVSWCWCCGDTSLDCCDRNCFNIQDSNSN